MTTFIEHILATQALALATGSASRTGPTIDLRGYYGVAFAIHVAPTVAGTNHQLTFQASPDGAVWSTLDGPQWTISGESLEEAVGVLDIGHPQYRYVRVLMTGDGVNDATVGVLGYRYRAHRKPVGYPTGGELPLAMHYHAPKTTS